MIKCNPPLFVFSQDYTSCDSPELVLELVIASLASNTSCQDWLDFWQKNGEEIVLSSWNEKYKDYLATEKETELCTEVIAEIPEEADTVYASVESWDSLWKAHYEDVYVEYYQLYVELKRSYQYAVQNNLKRAALCHESTSASISASEDEGTIDIVDELRELRLLGLPTRFGSTQRVSTTAVAKNKYSQEYVDEFGAEEEYTDTISDSESDLEEDMGKIKDIDSTHHLQCEQGSVQKKKKKNRKLRKLPQLIQENKALLRYWHKRFSLFARFDEGIQLDHESWFSVTPEKIATHIAERFSRGTVLDAFCGCGGNAIQFACVCQNVIAIDIDPKKIEMAKHNARIYGVEAKIDFIVGDFLQIAAAGGRLKCDAVFLSPPWGGPTYKTKDSYDIEKFLKPVGASQLLNISRNISENLALYLPRNSNVHQIIKLAGVGKRCEIEHNYLDTRLVALTAFYGDQMISKGNSQNAGLLSTAAEYL